MNARRRISAYVLVADPSFLRQSLSAYYAYVDRIVLSYDRSSISWTGTSLPIDQCLRIIAEIDIDGKCEHHPGDFARLDRTAFDNETYQRQVALDEASTGADWVLQLDTDEVMLRPDVFIAMLERADKKGAAGLDFPSRWLYTRVSRGRYLEVAGRLWQSAASYPGPLAVRAGTILRHARQADIELFRVDFAVPGTDRWRARDAPVHAVIPVDSAVMHFSWVRDPDMIRRKFAWSGHTDQMRPPKVLRRWLWRTRHPVLTILTTPFRRRNDGQYRLARIPEPPGGEPPVITFTPAEDRAR